MRGAERSDVGREMERERARGAEVWEGGLKRSFEVILDVVNLYNFVR